MGRPGPAGGCMQPFPGGERPTGKTMVPGEDEADVDAVLSGDVERFAAIVARWEGPLLKLAWRFVHDRERAEEMAQEAFVQCFRRLRQWRGDSRFGTWLFSVALNVYRSRLRT